jgi:hypothetical protein
MKILFKLIEGILFLALFFLSLHTIFAVIVPQMQGGASFIDAIKFIGQSIIESIGSIFGA